MTKAKTTRTPKAQIRNLLKQFDTLAGSYAKAVIAGHRVWAKSRKRRLDLLAKRILRLARKHDLLRWVSQQLNRN